MSYKLILANLQDHIPKATNTESIFLINWIKPTSNIAKNKGKNSVKKMGS